jgi:hypothetical protein
MVLGVLQRWRLPPQGSHGACAVGYPMGSEYIEQQTAALRAMYEVRPQGSDTQRA